MSPYKSKPILEEDLLPLFDFNQKSCMCCNCAFIVDNKYNSFLKIWFCKGGQYGFFWLKKCLEKRPHIHNKCKNCGAEYITATKNSGSFL